jgi:hypothetical protein
MYRKPKGTWSEKCFGIVSYICAAFTGKSMAVEPPEDDEAVGWTVGLNVGLWI